MALLAPIHVATKLLLRRSAWPRRFLAGAAWIVGARVTVAGRPPEPHSLIVANHVSWLDILVLGGATGCAFVSKDQLGHPLIHWLADQNRTIYVNRDARRQVGEQAAALAFALERGEIVAVFPEGTTGPGDRLLPFRPPLFAAATGGGRAFTVRPVAIRYPDAAEISWFEQSARENVLRILDRPGTLPVTVTLLDPLGPGDRKELAARARDQIAAALGFKSPVHSPIDGEQ